MSTALRHTYTRLLKKAVAQPNVQWHIQFDLFQKLFGSVGNLPTELPNKSEPRLCTCRHARAECTICSHASMDRPVASSGQNSAASGFKRWPDAIDNCMTTIFWMSEKTQALAIPAGDGSKVCLAR
eukprot:scaffold47654_cov45-Prasinocladus_malaysianus.AAC.1